MPQWLDRVLGRNQESALGDYADFVSESDFDNEFSTPYNRKETVALGRIGIRGRFPQEWTHEDRLQVILRAHQAWELNPLAKAGVHLIRRFVVGDGLQLTYSSPKVEEVVEAWRTEHKQKIRKWEKQLFDQLLIDGEIFIRVFTNGMTGEFSDVRIAALKPWFVEDIKTEPGDRAAVESYNVVSEVGTGTRQDPYRTSGVATPIPSDEIIHTAINSLGYDTRGRSELYAIMPWLQGYKKWLENRARINEYKGLMYHDKIKNATKGDISAAQARYTRPMLPNSVLVTSDKEEMIELGQQTNADNVAEDGRQIKMMVAIGFGVPEYMLSDGENSNLATTKSQQLPALRSFKDYQDIYIEQCWIPIYDAVIRAAIGDGEVQEIDDDGEATGKTISVFDAYTLSAPDIVETDPKELAEALQIETAAGWVSDRTASTKLGFDWEKEKGFMDVEGQDRIEKAAEFERELGGGPDDSGGTGRGAERRPGQGGGDGDRERESVATG